MRNNIAVRVIVRDELVDNGNPLALFEQNVLTTGYGTLIPKEPNWTCLQFFLTRPHPFLTTPSFLGLAYY